ncbi:caspase family protein [Breoghania sp.]|uniref:caspase family protein n=1 Tax=Breoghania sp. TaxID=2065378 RepID=UPI0026380471|nr:caspase family protein [Breoghania sp.]MDJ0930351.1 caspase family protein [Breoghania sp.]
MPPKTSEDGRKVAILLGNRVFPDEPGLHDLKCPINDVDGFAAILRDPKIGDFNDVVILKDQVHGDVLETVHETISTLMPKDTLFFYYSGHGKLDLDGHLHLATRNTTLDKLAIRSLSFGTVRGLITNAKSISNVLMLDCCFSGAIDEQFHKGDVLEAAIRPQQGSGIVVFTSSSDIQTSREDPETGHGLFTGAIIEGIRSGHADMDADGQIDVADLRAYIGRNFEGTQTLQFFARKLEGRIIIAKSGHDILAKTMEELKEQLTEWLKTEEITEPQYSAVTSAMKKPAADRSAIKVELVRLAQDVIAGCASVEQFWARYHEALESTATKPIIPPAPHRKAFGQMPRPRQRIIAQKIFQDAERTTHQQTNTSKTPKRLRQGRLSISRFSRSSCRDLADSSRLRSSSV